ncbi:hypothetical protein DMB66_15090 [Actinoplanes sp. ATCC 53533]|nr:hypothetical protein DMB66_15090 [Actinoplanes sp. ATCC 53533]
MVFAGAAAVSVLTTFADLDGGVPDAAGAIALLAAAAYVALLVRRPVARRALSAGIVVLAAVPVVSRAVVDDVSPLDVSRRAGLDDVSPLDVSRAGLDAILSQRADALHAGTVLLLIAAAALVLGVAALPQFRRPVWLTALAGLVALGPVAAVAHAAAGAQRDPFLSNREAAVLIWHFAPGFAATVLAGLALVLAVSRADRWFLLPAGALLLQVTTADRAEDAAGAWWSFGGGGFETSSAFLEPGLRIDVSFAAVAAPDWHLDAATATAALLLASALLAAGAVRTAGTDAMVGPPGEPPAAGPDWPGAGPDRPQDA